MFAVAMGWTSVDAGRWGDAPQDAMDASVEGVRRAVDDPTPRALLACLVDALGCDGRSEPFTSERRAITTLSVALADGVVAIGPGGGAPRAVAMFYDALDEVATAHLDAWGRPPSLRELLVYVANAYRSHWADDRGGDAIAEATATFGRAKPRDRAPRPNDRVVEAARVAHPKFGAGSIVDERGDQVVVDFDTAGRRTLLRRALVRA